MNRRDKSDGKKVLANRRMRGKQGLLHKDCRSTRRELAAFGLETNERTNSGREGRS